MSDEPFYQYGHTVRLSSWDVWFSDMHNELLNAMRNMIARDFTPWDFPDRPWANRIDWDLLVAPTYTNLTEIPHKVRQYVKGKRIVLSDWIYPRDMEF